MLAANLFLLGLAPPPLPPDTNPALIAEQRRAPIRDTFLTLDGRSVLVRFTRGRCEGIAAATVTPEGPRVTLGTDPAFKGVCRSSLEADSVVIPVR